MTTRAKEICRLALDRFKGEQVKATAAKAATNADANPRAALATAFWDGYIQAMKRAGAIIKEIKVKK